MKIYNPFDIMPDENFDWGLYENGFVGGNKLVVNKSISTTGRDKVFCHESYACVQYKKFLTKLSGQVEDYSSKDMLRGDIFRIISIKALNDHEIMVDTNSGLSAVVDLNKEKPYLNVVGCETVAQFMYSLANYPDYIEQVLEDGMIAKVLPGGRVSLWDGHLSKIEAEFMEQVKNPAENQYMYMAKVKEINGGGYLVDVSGVRCFLPGSLAAAGIITDFSVLLGKEIPVMIVNYVPNSGFVVSYKKYLQAVLPVKIREELNIGMKVNSKITGTSKNGIFVQFKDKDGEWIFSGLIHRSTMSNEFEKRFDRKEFRTGDQMMCFIHSIVQKDNQTRIILGDEYPEKLNDEEDD